MQANIAGQVSDIHAAIQWLGGNVKRYGGDASRIVLMGSSAGGHLTALYLGRRARLDLDGNVNISPDADGTGETIIQPRIVGYVGLSGVYNITRLADVNVSAKEKLVHLVFGDDESSWKQVCCVAIDSRVSGLY